MAIFLLILKWIGLIVAGIIGLLLFLCAIVLFVPVRYRAKASMAKEISYSIRISWLFRIITFHMDQDNDLQCRIFGIHFHRRHRKDKSKQNNDKTETITSEEHAEEHTSIEKKSEVKQTVQTREKKKRKGKKEKKRKNKKKHFSFERFFSIIDFIRDKKNKQVIHRMLHELRGLLGHIAPRRIKLHVMFGFDDPAHTGMVLGIVSLFPMVYQKGMQIYPVFDRAVLEGDASIRGRIYGITLLSLAIRLYRDKELRRFIHDCKSI